MLNTFKKFLCGYVIFSIIVTVHFLGFISYVHQRLAILNLVIASVFKKEGVQYCLLIQASYVQCIL